MALWGAKLKTPANGSFRSDVTRVCAQDDRNLRACPQPYVGAIGTVSQAMLEGIRSSTLSAQI